VVVVVVSRKEQVGYHKMRKKKKGESRRTRRKKFRTDGGGSSPALNGRRRSAGSVELHIILCAEQCVPQLPIDFSISLFLFISFFFPFKINREKKRVALLIST
jgi:hypothetical protein